MNIVRSIEEESIIDLLETVKDPEVPVLSIIDLGVLRNVEIIAEEVIITITPTYSGCPAMVMIEQQIDECLKANNYPNYSIKTVLSPAWTTDWMTESGKKKLEIYGIAPPVKETQDKSQLFQEPKKIKCPRCKNEDTKMLSQFGSTACKSLYQCNNCHEPFDYFKCL